MATPDPDSLANGLVSIGADAIAKSNDALLDDYFTDDYTLRSLPALSTRPDQARRLSSCLEP